MRSRPSGLVSFGAGWEIARGYRLQADLFNALNAKASDIDYFYVSRLPGEAQDGVGDLHMHPVQPRSIRIGVAKSF